MSLGVRNHEKPAMSSMCLSNLLLRIGRALTAVPTSLRGSLLSDDGRSLNGSAKYAK